MTTREFYNRHKADTVRLNQKHAREKKSSKGEYIIYEGTSIDTLLNLNAKDKLKFYSNGYYLNQFNSRKNWDIYQLIPNAERGFAIHITNEQDKEKLSKFIVSSPGHLFGTIVHLSDAQFYDFIKNDGFGTRYQFKKQS